jgi:tRNA-modifying protein YgfZ
MGSQFIDLPFFFPIQSSGLLCLIGPDQISFLQRQTTNDVRNLKPGHTLLTVLTTPEARIEDILYTFLGEEGINIVTLPERAPATFRYLKKRVFFMDKVTLLDRSSEFSQIELYGPGCEKFFSQLRGFHLPKPDEVFTFSYQGQQIILLEAGHPLGLGWKIIIPVGFTSTLINSLVEAGIQQATPFEYSLTRIEAGLPSYPGELNGNFTPYELGFEAVVSTSKGCYTGQEILARQLSFDKITQHLRGLRLTQPVSLGDKLWSAERHVGTVTSSALSPRFGPIALAMIRRPFSEPGTLLKAGFDKEALIEGQVTSLPFT